MDLRPRSPQGLTETVFVPPPTTLIVTNTPSAGATVVKTITPSVDSTSPAPSATNPANQAISGSNDGGLNSGAVAGVAIGCIIAGIAIGAIAAIWFLRRRRSVSPEETQYMLAYTNGGGYDPKDPTGHLMAADPFRLDQILPAPLPDEVIAAELQNLSRLIQQHVMENYDHRELVPVDQNILHRAMHDLGLGNDSSMPSGQLVILTVSPQGRSTALQHIIARAATASVVLSSTARHSLLPSSMSAFMREVAPTERDRGSAKAVSAAFTRWRQISTFLINPNRSERTSLLPTEAMTGHKARELVATLNVVLGPFIDLNQVDRYRQEAQLYNLVMEIARFGYMLISQPGEFRLRWDAGPSMEVGSDVVVVCPGLDKISDEHGNRYTPLRTLLAPVAEIVR